MLQTIEKPQITAADLDAQDGFVLPARETMLVTVVITNLLNHNVVSVDVRNNNVAVQVCAVVTALSTLVSTPLSCDVQQ